MIYHIHLVNGDEIMGFVSAKTIFQTEFNVINPMRIFNSVLESGAPIKVLKRYINNYNKENVNCIISKSHIVAMYECDEDFSEYYKHFLYYNIHHFDGIEKSLMTDIASTLLSHSNNTNTVINDKSNTYH